MPKLILSDDRPSSGLPKPNLVLDVEFRRVAAGCDDIFIGGSVVGRVERLERPVRVEGGSHRVRYQQVSAFDGALVDWIEPVTCFSRRDAVARILGYQWADPA